MAFDIGSLLSGAGNWFEQNPLAALAGGADIFKLIGNINNMVQSNNAQQAYQRTAQGGFQPNINTFYQPMTDAARQAYLRGVTANAQQSIPVQGQAFNDLLGSSLAKEETNRYNTAAQQAYQQWLAQLGQRGNVYGTTTAQAGAGAPGQNLMQYLILRSLMNARDQGSQTGQTGQTYNPQGVGQMYDPYASQMQPPSTFGGGGGSPLSGIPGQPTPYASGAFTDTSSAETGY